MTEAHGFTLSVRPARSEDGGAHGWTNYATRTVWVNSDCDLEAPDLGDEDGVMSKE